MFEVVMCIYSGDQFSRVRKALDSIAQQTLLPTRLIIVLDGYVEFESQVVDECERMPFNFCILKLPSNKGLATAMNLGLQEVVEEYVIRADADDVNDPKRFEYLVNAFIDNPLAAIVGSNVCEKGLGHPMIRKVPDRKVNLNFSAFLRNPINHPSVAFRSEALRQVGGYTDLRYREDWFVALKVLSAGYHIVNIQHNLVDMHIDHLFYERRKSEFLNNDLEFFKACLIFRPCSLQLFIAQQLRASAYRLMRLYGVEKFYRALLRVN